MPSALQIIVKLAVFVVLPISVVSTNETTTAPMTTYPTLSDIDTGTTSITVNVCFNQNASSITNFTSTFATDIKDSLATALSVNSTQISNLTAQGNASACLYFQVVGGSGLSPYQTGARLQHLLNTTGLNVTLNNDTFVFTNTGLSISGDPITTSATTASTASTASSTNSTTASASSTNATTAAATTASTTVTTTTAAFQGVSNEASQVTAEMALPGNFSAITNTSAFVDEVKPQLATKLSVNVSQIQNVQIRSGSIIIKFDIVSGSGSSPATALGTLRTLITSGSLAISSTALGNITANASYVVGYEVTTPTSAITTAGSSVTTSSSSIISCFVCNGTTLCNNYQKSCDTMNNCTSGQHCWIDRVHNSKGTYHTRYCGTACTSTYNKEYCVSTGSATTCRKCCSTGNCNVDVLTGASNIASIPNSLLLISMAILAHLLAPIKA